MKSQELRVLEALKQGRVTSLSALTDLGVYRLSARLDEIKHRGYQVQSRWIEVTNRFGEKTRVKEYWL